MELSEQEARKRAARGAARLDVIKPGWAGTINREALDMRSGAFCVAAQIYGRDYCFISSTLANELDPEMVALAWEVNTYYGFYIDSNDEDGFPIHSLGESYRRLTEAWRAEIEQRITQLTPA